MNHESPDGATPNSTGVLAVVLRAINSLVSEGVITNYALCGAVAALFYTEIVATGTAMNRPRLSPEKQAEIYEAKKAWHEEQANLPIEEKFRILLKLQKIHYQLALARGDKLEWWQKPWPIEIEE